MLLPLGISITTLTSSGGSLPGFNKCRSTIVLSEYQNLQYNIILLGIITKNINTGRWIGIVLMELQRKFNAKSIENEIRCYLNDIDLKEYLEKEFLFNNNNLLGYI